jgi:filamentous hemagglutinin family protein
MHTTANRGVEILHHAANILCWSGFALLTGSSAFAGLPDPSVQPAAMGHGDTAIAKSSVALDVAPAMPGTAIIVSNPYGDLSVIGGTLVGNTIYNLQPNAVIQLGTVAGGGSAALALHFQGFNIGPGNVLTLRSGAPLQVVVLYNADSSASTIGGALLAEGGNGALPPYVYFANPNGLAVTPGGRVASTTGLTIDTLGSSDLEGESLVNDGVLDGGAYLRLQSARITGSGAFRADNAHVATFGSANNPVLGAHFLANGLQFHPSTVTAVELTLSDYGDAPQVLNFMVNGDASVFMPSVWPPAWSEPPNNLPVPLGGIRPPGVPEPSYGGGSMIVQATGSLTLRSSKSNDFVFPGAIVLKAGSVLNLNGVLVNQGWTATGRAFQGVFLESPYIMSSDPIRVATNNMNWVNFSTFPQAPVRTWQLVPMPDGSLQYVTADSVAPHLNTYSVLVEIAATGGCWTCAMNTAPVDMY